MASAVAATATVAPSAAEADRRLQEIERLPVIDVESLEDAEASFYPAFCELPPVHEWQLDDADFYTEMLPWRYGYQQERVPDPYGPSVRVKQSTRVTGPPPRHNQAMFLISGGPGTGKTVRNRLFSDYIRSGAAHRDAIAMAVPVLKQPCGEQDSVSLAGTIARYCDAPRSVMICTPTGVAASLYRGGMTAHDMSALKPPTASQLATTTAAATAEMFATGLRLILRQAMDYRSLAKRIEQNRLFERDGDWATAIHTLERLSHTKGARFTECLFLFIDEISMLEGDIVNHIQLCARQLNDAMTEFGGKHVIFTGDFMQLRPPKGDWIFRQNAGSVFRECFDLGILRCISLEVNHRQGKGDKLAAVVAEMRTCPREKGLSAESIALLRQRKCDSSYDSLRVHLDRLRAERPLSLPPLFLTALNDQVKEFNRHFYAQTPGKEFTFPSRLFIEHRRLIEKKDGKDVRRVLLRYRCEIVLLNDGTGPESQGGTADFDEEEEKGTFGDDEELRIGSRYHTLFLSNTVISHLLRLANPVAPVASPAPMQSASSSSSSFAFGHPRQPHQRQQQPSPKRYKAPSGPDPKVVPVVQKAHGPTALTANVNVSAGLTNHTRVRFIRAGAPRLQIEYPVYRLSELLRRLGKSKPRPVLFSHSEPMPATQIGQKRKMDSSASAPVAEYCKTPPLAGIELTLKRIPRKKIHDPTQSGPPAILYFQELHPNNLLSLSYQNAHVYEIDKQTRLFCDYMPLRPDYARTVDNVQGSTLSHGAFVNMDGLGKRAAQFTVAISRPPKLELLHLMHYYDAAFKPGTQNRAFCDRDALEFTRLVEENSNARREKKIQFLKNLIVSAILAQRRK